MMTIQYAPYNMGDKDWQADYVEPKSDMQYPHNSRGKPTQTNQKIVRELGGHLYAGHTQGNT